MEDEGTMDIDEIVETGAKRWREYEEWEFEQNEKEGGWKNDENFKREHDAVVEMLSERGDPMLDVEHKMFRKALK